MDIGEKIKHARSKAKLTQEQVAEALGVSRQTISNWENEKTYPDIVSVVKMSDLYDISVDHLLKGEPSMSNYLDYLEESTNAVKSKNKFSKLLLAVTYLGIWAISLIAFWLFNSGSDAMGYSIMFLWILLPVTTFVVSLLIGMNYYYEHKKWLLTVAFGVMYMFAEYATFSTLNMVAFDKVNAPQFGMIPIGTMISLAGMAIGHGIHYAASKKKNAQRP